MAMIRRATRFAALLVLLIALIGCALLPTRCSRAPSHEEATPTPIPTRIVPTKPTYEVQRGEIVKTLQFEGRIAPVVEEELFFRTSGSVGAVYVKKDEWVHAGEILAELEVTDLKNQLAQAEAALEVALSNNEQRITEAQVNLRTAELRLARTEADDPDPQVVIARVAVERAQTALANAQKAYQDALDRPGEQDKVREAAVRQVREAELSLEVAEAQHQQALQARSVHNYNVQIQEQEVALARLGLQQLESGVDIEEIRLTVELLKAPLEDARLVAPIDGLLLSFNLSEGDRVNAHRPVAIVGDPGELEVSANLTVLELQELAEGMPITVVPLSRPGEEIKGHIRRLPYPYGGGGGSTGIVRQDKSTRVALEATAVERAAETGYELGSLVRVTVVLERKDHVLWLPPQAIRIFEGRRFVVVQEGEAQLRVDVKVGIETEDRVEIEEGLSEGQVVIGQ